jgi:hypothetical protein
LMYGFLLLGLLRIPMDPQGFLWTPIDSYYLDS